MKNLFRLRERDGMVFLTSYIGDEEIVTIPDDYKGKPVRGISRNCFNKCEQEVLRKIKEIILPDTIVLIERYAFSGCVALEKIVLPKKLRFLKQYAFYNCSNLTEITLHENIEQIGQYCFFGCSSLNKITYFGEKINLSETAIRWGLPLEDVSLNFLTLLDLRYQTRIVKNKLQKFSTFSKEEQKQLISFINRKPNLKKAMFSDCDSNIIDLLLDNKVKINLVLLNDFIQYHIEKQNTPVTAILLEHKEKNYTKKDAEVVNERKELVEIGFEMPTFTELRHDWSFAKRDDEIIIYSYKGISSKQTLPATLSDGTPISRIKITDNSDFSTLEHLTIEAQLIYIESYTFYKCQNLISVILPESLIDIGGRAFYDCIRLTEIKLPEKLKSISFSAFCNCSSLKEITLPKSLGRISESAFNNCTSLKDVIIPENVTYICDYAFRMCESFHEMVIPEKVKDLGYAVFSDCKNLKKVEILSNIKILPQSFFEDCVNLEEVILPDSITEIDKFAFCGCKNLKKVNVPAKLKFVCYNAFMYCDLFDKSEFDDLKKLVN